MFDHSCPLHDWNAYKRKSFVELVVSKTSSNSNTHRNSSRFAHNHFAKTHCRITENMYDAVINAIEFMLKLHQVVLIRNVFVLTCQP